jgi:hypothetical protein
MKRTRRDNTDVGFRVLRFLTEFKIATYIKGTSIALNFSYIFVICLD